ncbi:hypothetical protein ACFVKC_14840 [Streptomyces noursei]|uniref:hypothetical protein n=1 Tax=Streptomyces noursei TaxID=1971 RepID=UPI00362723F4
MVQPTATTGPADPGEPADDPAPDADTGPAADADDDGGEADEKGPAEKPSASRPATTRREHRSGTVTAKKPADDDQEHADKRGGILGKDTVGRALDKLMPGTKDVLEQVPDWAWPFGSFLTATAAPGTSVDLEVGPPDPATDAVTVTATMTAADGPSEGTPLEVAVTVTPPAPETPSEPATVAVEVTNTATGESVTMERETAPEAVTVTAMVATVATVQDALNDSSEAADEPSREDYAPAA